MDEEKSNNNRTNLATTPPEDETDSNISDDMPEEKVNSSNKQVTPATPLLKDDTGSNDSQDVKDVASHLLGVCCGIVAAVGLAGSSICVQLLEGMGKLVFWFVSHVNCGRMTVYIIQYNTILVIANISYHLRTVQVEMLPTL